MKKWRLFERFLLFVYVLDNGGAIPEKYGTPEALFAQLLNITLEEAEIAAQECLDRGFIEHD